MVFRISRLTPCALGLLLCVAAMPAHAQEDAPVALDTEAARMSYALGMRTAQQLKQAEVEVVPEAYVQAFKDIMSGAEPQLSEEELMASMQAFATEMRSRRAEEMEAAASEAKAQGAAFLEQKAQEEGIVALESGVLYEIVEEGEGPTPTAQDTVTVHYSGQLLDGTEFDSSYKRGQPATFPLSGVIPGWRQGLQELPVGTKAKLYIPSDQAYGDRGQPPQIGPGETLVFDVELLGIEGDGGQ